jgi:hypothetical protein
MPEAGPTPGSRGVKFGRKPKLTPHQPARNDQATRRGRGNAAFNWPQLQRQPADNFAAGVMTTSLTPSILPPRDDPVGKTVDMSRSLEAMASMYLSPTGPTLFPIRRGRRSDRSHAFLPEKPAILSRRIRTPDRWTRSRTVVRQITSTRFNDSKWNDGVPFVSDHTHVGGVKEGAAYTELKLGGGARDQERCTVRPVVFSVKEILGGKVGHP